MVDGQAQASAGILAITRRTRQHQGVDADLDQALVVFHRLQALHFDVISLHRRFLALG